MADHPPLLLKPHYVIKPWGGRRMETMLGRDDLPDGPVGESWEAVDTDEMCSVVDGGPFDGNSLRAVVGEPFPLLLKVLDANADLSVQVHPDGHDGEPAKEEAWISLGDTGSVAIGAGAADTAPGEWLERLERHSLSGGSADKPPTMIHVPPGTVHAILAGAFVYEVQNPVNVTWRLYDYDRPGVDGNPRELHADQAAVVLGRGPEAGGAMSADWSVLQGRRFEIALLPPGGHAGVRGRAVFLAAGGTLTNDADGTFEVPFGRTVVLPPRAFTVESDGWAIVSSDRAMA